MPTDQQWRGVVNGVLYTVQYDRDLADERVIADRAAQLVSRPLFDQPVQALVDALRAALASGEQLTGRIPQPHDESDVRTFLARLADRMEALRPWPHQPYRKLPAHAHPELLQAPAIALITADWKQAADRLRRTADHTGEHAVLALELDTGDIVAIVDDWDITPGGGRRDGRSTLVTTSRNAPAEVLAAFRTATGLSPDEAVPL